MMDDIIRLYEAATGTLYDGEDRNSADIGSNGDASDRPGTSTSITSSNEVDDNDGPVSDSEESDIDREVNESDESGADEDENDNGGVDPNIPSEWTDILSPVTVAPFTESPGPVHNLAFDRSPLDYLHLFLPKSFFKNVATETNRYAEQVQAAKNKTDDYWKPVTEHEIRLFFAINTVMGIVKLPSYRCYWSQDSFLRQNSVADLMGLSRFSKICQYFHLNDSTTAVPRGQPGYDPLHKVRPMLKSVLQGCKSNLKPWREISIDEAMIGYNGRLNYKQYIKNKPTPWGIKVWCVSCSLTGFLLNFEIYTGKSTVPRPHGTGYHIITKLGQPFLNLNHHFYYDRFFSSVKLAEDLLQQNTYSCSTIMPNRKGWPASLKSKAIKALKMKSGDVTMLQKGNLVATVWKDKRPVILLSTNCNARMVTVSRRAPGGPKDIEIPESVETYNQWMGGVDLTDQLHSYYTVIRKSRKYWRYMCWFFMDVAITNAWILWKLSHQPKIKGRDRFSHLEFRKELIRQLSQGSVRKRKARASPSVEGIGKASEQHPGVRLAGSKKTCYQCSKDKRRNPTGRTPETVWGCSICCVHLCKGHCFGKFHQELSQ